jgi:mRNA interferase RelE/StbE
MYSIEFTTDARKVLLRLPRDQQALILSKIEMLACDPFVAPNVKKLVGEPGYRLRVGSWRVIYDVESGRLVIRIVKIGSRGGVYK